MKYTYRMKFGKILELQKKYPKLGIILIIGDLVSRIYADLGTDEVYDRLFEALEKKLIELEDD